MNDGIRDFEIAWRELLVKRLKTAQGVLKRDAAAEIKALKAKAIEEAGYNTVEDAHEAYGWNEITAKQFDLIKLQLENPGKSPSAAALNKLNFTVGILEGEIRAFYTDVRIAQEYINPPDES